MTTAGYFERANAEVARCRIGRRYSHRNRALVRSDYGRRRRAYWSLAGGDDTCLHADLLDLLDVDLDDAGQADGTIATAGENQHSVRSSAARTTSPPLVDDPVTVMLARAIPANGPNHHRHADLGLRGGGQRYPVTPTGTPGEG